MSLASYYCSTPLNPLYYTRDVGAMKLFLIDRMITVYRRRSLGNENARVFISLTLLVDEFKFFEHTFVEPHHSAHFPRTQQMRTGFVSDLIAELVCLPREVERLEIRFVG